MFIGREIELKQLHDFQNRLTAGLIVCSGRRRIGKSTLIQRFGEGSRFLEFYGLAPRKNITNAVQLVHFAECLAKQLNIPKMHFNHWGDALDMLASLTQTGAYIIFLDEISWMAENDADFVGKLKGIWDTKFKKNNALILVLCGSVTSWIQKNILEDKGFMGRISLNIRLGELPLHDANKFWQDRFISAAEKFRVLSVTGGIPRYLEEINPAETAEQNIKRLCFSKGGILIDEFEKIFKDIFEEQADSYKQIVNALKNKNLSTEEICQKIGIKQSGSFNSKLKALEQCGFIARDYVWKKSIKSNKLSKYRLCDNYLRFYLKYIEGKKDLIEKGLYYDVHLEDFDDWYSIMGLQFENLVLNNLSAIQKKLGIAPASLLSASPYFQNKTQRQNPCQVDLLIQTKHTVYVCEIKFRKKITTSIVAEVAEKIVRLKMPSSISVRPVLIYQGELARAVKNENFFSHLICFDEMLG